MVNQEWRCDGTEHSIVGKAQVLLITMALFYLRVPVSHDSVTASQHAQYQDLVTEDATVNLNQPSLTLLFAPVLFPR